MRLAQAVRARRRDALLAAAVLLTVLSFALENYLVFFGGLLLWMISRPCHREEEVGS